MMNRASALRPYLTQHPVANKRKNLMAARLSFGLLGGSMAVWGALIPFVKVNISVDPATLGILLLCLGLGAVLAMPFAGGLSSRYGCKAVLQWSLMSAFALLFGLTFANQLWICAIGLLLFGVMTSIVPYPLSP